MYLKMLGSVFYRYSYINQFVKEPQTYNPNPILRYFHILVIFSLNSGILKHFPNSSHTTFIMPFFDSEKYSKLCRA